MIRAELEPKSVLGPGEFALTHTAVELHTVPTKSGDGVIDKCHVPILSHQARD
jgi:hypothetical protein